MWLLDQALRRILRRGELAVIADVEVVRLHYYRTIPHW